jgi:hypothetical protein
MRSITASTARAARLLLLLMAVIGLQPVSAGQAASPASPSQVSPAALLAGPPVPLPVPGIDEQGDSGDGRTPSPADGSFAGEQTGRATAPSACTAEFCPWRASDALARAGRRSSPSTAPPASSV